MLDLTKIPFEASPNFTKGRKEPIKHIILHAMVGTYTGSKNWFKNKTAKVSANYLVGQQGELCQMVKNEDTAWHCYGVNASSIGIEMEDKGHCMKDGSWITPKLWQTATELAAALCKAYYLPVTAIEPHSAPWIQALGKAKGFAHQDPGKFFNVEKFRQDVQKLLDSK